MEVAGASAEDKRLVTAIDMINKEKGDKYEIKRLTNNYGMLERTGC